MDDDELFELFTDEIQDDGGIIIDDERCKGDCDYCYYARKHEPRYFYEEPKPYCSLYPQGDY